MSKASYENRWHDKVLRFNNKFLPGTSVVFTKQNGMRFKTRIRYPAIVLGNGEPVVWLENIRNYCRLDRVLVTL